VFSVASERAADQVAGAKTHGESKRKHDATKENAKGQPNDAAADPEMPKDHGGGKHKHEPLDAER
jgi:hypothetical protein